MIKILRMVVFGLVLFSAVTSMMCAQGVPVQTASPVYQGYKVPTLAGTLHYSLSAAENISLGFNTANQTTYATALSGNVGFITSSVLYPTTVTYSGGYLIGSGSESSSYFQALSASQAFNRRSYSITLTDSLSFLPQSPSTGLAGLPGLGDLGSGGGVTPTVLTASGDRISNDASASFTDRLTGKTSLSIGGEDTTQRFLGTSNGLQSNGFGGSASLSHRIDARTSYSGSYHYSQSSYSGQTGTFESQGATLSFNRQVTRQLQASFGGGPERIGGSTITGVGPEYTYNASVHLSYTGRGESPTSYGLGFVRASNAGSGVSAGAETNSAFFSASRRLAQSLNGSASVAYAQNTGLQLLTTDSFSSKSVIGSGQLNRALTRTISVYASYSAQHQVVSGVSQGIAPLQGLVQTLGFGITYSPSEVRLGRR